MSFDESVRPHNHRHIPDTPHFHHPRESLVPLWFWFPGRHSPSPRILSVLEFLINGIARRPLFHVPLSACSPPLVRPIVVESVISLWGRPLVFPGANMAKCVHHSLLHVNPCCLQFLTFTSAQQLSGHEHPGGRQFSSALSRCCPSLSRQLE